MAAASSTRSRSSPSTGVTSGVDGVRSSTALTLSGSQRSASRPGRHAAPDAHPRPIGCSTGVIGRLADADHYTVNAPAGGTPASRPAARGPAGRGGLRPRCRACGRVRHAEARAALRRPIRAGRRPTSPGLRPSCRPGPEAAAAPTTARGWPSAPVGRGRRWSPGSGRRRHRPGRQVVARPSACLGSGARGPPTRTGRTAAAVPSPRRTALGPSDRTTARHRRAR